MPSLFHSFINNLCMPREFRSHYSSYREKKRISPSGESINGVPKSQPITWSIIKKCSFVF
jgi:hypothetical protein